MATYQNALACAGLAVVFWTCIGWPLASRLLHPALALPTALALGWSVHSVIALVVLSWIGITQATVLLIAGLSLAAALSTAWVVPKPGNDPAGPWVPTGAIVAAGLISVVIMAAILPKISDQGVALSGAIFDHAKIAMVDDIVRLGVPAGNPFFGEAGASDKLSYYYLWHFSAAELALVTGLSGWDADAGLTFFTALSSLMLMMGLATWISARKSAAYWVLVISASASIRPVFTWVFGSDLGHAITGWPTGFGAWPSNVTWAPQHTAAAGSAMLAVVVLLNLARKPAALSAVLFGLTGAAAFESSTWVGGVTLPLAVIAVAGAAIFRMANDQRRLFLVYVLAGSVLALALIFPFLQAQFQASVARADGLPIAVVPYWIVGNEVPIHWQPVFNLLAYWTIFLFTEFAAFYPAGVFAWRRLSQDSTLPTHAIEAVRNFGLVILASLAVGNLLSSTVGSNNDLAWRGVVPAILALVTLTAAGFARYLVSMRLIYSALALGAVLLGASFGIRNMTENNFAGGKAYSAEFVRSAQMWSAVRKHANGGERIANNPLFLDRMTPWPINISWALLARRRSCYAGKDLALPFAAVSRQRREEIDQQFIRVFAGNAENGDIQELADRYRCDVVVMTAIDQGWSRDPFQSSPLYQLVEEQSGQWRIYKRRAAGSG